MKRISLVPTQTNGDGTRSPTIPASASGFVTLHDFGPRALVKMTVPDGTAKTATTIADITIDANGRQVEVNAEPLTAAQRTAAKTFLQNNGFNVGAFDGDGIDDRAKLLRFILRRLAGWRDISVREMLDSWDVL